MSFMDIALHDFILIKIRTATYFDKTHFWIPKKCETLLKNQTFFYVFTGKQHSNEDTTPEINGKSKDSHIIPHSNFDLSFTSAGFQVSISII